MCKPFDHLVETIHWEHHSGKNEHVFVGSQIIGPRDGLYSLVRDLKYWAEYCCWMLQYIAPHVQLDKPVRFLFFTKSNWFIYLLVIVDWVGLKWYGRDKEWIRSMIRRTYHPHYPGLTLSPSLLLKLLVIFRLLESTWAKHWHVALIMHVIH